MKHFFAVAAVIAIAMTIGPGVFAGGIVGTKHDITAIPSQVGAAPGTDSVCVYCHTPHTTNYSPALWNKPAISGNYQPYASDTIDGFISPGMGSTTKLCLSCHDGSLAVYVMVTPPTDGSGFVTGLSGEPQGWNLDAGGMMLGPSAMDHDFRNEHPVSITYDTRDRHLINPPPAQYPLYSGLVECSTCHSVHDNTNPPFLRTSNDGSRMCMSCHNV